MKIKLIHWFALALIVQIGLLHLLNAQSEYEEAAYMGFLFAANFFGALLAALGIYYKEFWGWVLGLVIAGGSIAGYIWSRTYGMPDMNVEEWFSPYGIVAMVSECLFILLFVFRPWKPGPNEGLFEPASKMRYVFPLGGLLMIALISWMTFRWDENVTQAFGHHVGSLSQVCKTPVTSFTELEDQYGVQVVLAATSMMNSIVDVRVRIVDPDKAHALLQNQAALLVNQQALVLAPHMHSHNGNRLKAGKVFIIFFPTQQKIHQGSEISLVFGSIRTEAVIVR